ncbi:MAG: hypothetical protein ACR2PH_12125, partial [Desulfobulbia bacterium]
QYYDACRWLFGGQKRGRRVGQMPPILWGKRAIYGAKPTLWGKTKKAPKMEASKLLIYERFWWAVLDSNQRPIG